MPGDDRPPRETFEYAVIRLVPRVERGEAMNVGVVLYSQQHGYLDCRILLEASRLRALDPRADPAVAAKALTVLEQNCRAGGPATQSLGERFRWLTAPRSTIVQPGPVHSGLTDDPAAELEHLFDELVR